MGEIMTNSLSDSLRYRKLFSVSAVLSLLIVICLLGDFFVYALIPNMDSSTEIIKFFIESPVKGLLFFDLLGMISYLLFITIIISFFILLKKENESIILIGTVLFFIGITVFFATNTGFSVLRLSREFVATQSEAERQMILSSVKTMITLFDVQAFMISYVIVSLAWIFISIAMLRSDMFSKISSYSGLISGFSAIIAEIFENTFKELLNASIFFYFIALVALLIFVISTGLRLNKLRKLSA